MATIINVTATIENLNMTGVIEGTSTTFSSATAGAIPFDNIGLYQLINQMISDLSSIKATIKTNEKNLIKDLAIEPDDDSTVTLTNSVGVATHESSIANHKARNRLVEYSKTIDIRSRRTKSKIFRRWSFHINGIIII